jgi:hypothetical protein
MAQVTPKLRWFEQHWRPRLNLAARLLRRFEDRWLRSEGPFPSREVVAVLVNVFAFDFHSAGFLRYPGIPADELWTRSLDEWVCSVGSPESECVRLSPNRGDSERSELVEAFCSMVSCAAVSWESNAPENPACEEVVQRMFDEMVARRFAVIRYG